MPDDQDPRDYGPLKPDFFHILLALSDQNRHGYGIIKAVEKVTEGRILLEPSPLYRRLKRLLEDGIVAEVEAPANLDHDDERRRYYGLTPLGHRVLAAEASRLVALAESSKVRSLALSSGRELQ
ncbi:MAG: helix-turn-helix transcriptional regulator [Gemmatimonadales bacterium]